MKLILKGNVNESNKDYPSSIVCMIWRAANSEQRIASSEQLPIYPFNPLISTAISVDFTILSTFMLSIACWGM